MRVPTLLRQIRTEAAMSLTDVEELTGLHRGTLSKLETGRELPDDRHRDALELAYGPAHLWYPPEVLLLLQRDRDETPA